MKKELLLQLPFLISLFILITVIKEWFSFSHWPFWLGGLIGCFLPYLDHIFYVFLLRPYELTSQRVKYYLIQKDYKNALKLLADTKYERKDLILHSVYFQIVFAILTFWVLTSSGSLLGRGLVLSFYLHLLVDEYKDFQNEGTIDRWFRGTDINLDSKGKVYYLLIATLLLVIFSFFF